MTTNPKPALIPRRPLTFLIALELLVVAGAGEDTLEAAGFEGADVVRLVLALLAGVDEDTETGLAVKIGTPRSNVGPAAVA